MNFIRTKQLNIEIMEDQQQYLSSKEKIKRMLKEPDVIAFNIEDGNQLIGFAMFKVFDKNSFFLWDYLIDYKYQNKGLGTRALIELIELLKDKYRCKKVTTTYKYGNVVAQRLYEKLGFIETSVVNENDINEVNMTLEL